MSSMHFTFEYTIPHVPTAAGRKAACSSRIADAAMRASVVEAAKQLCAVRANATLQGCVNAVLTHICGMLPGTKGKGLRVTKQGSRGAQSYELVAEWTVVEGAPGGAERVLVWSDKLRRRVEAADFKAEEAAFDAQCDEQERQRRLRAVDDEFATYGGDCGDAADAAHAPAAPGAAAAPAAPIAPYDPLVTYEPYDAP